MRAPAILGSLLVLTAVPAVCAAQVPPSSMPSYARPSYAARETELDGRVVGNDGSSTLEVVDDRGEVHDVRVDAIPAAAAAFPAGVRVAVRGVVDGPELIAERIAPLAEMPEPPQPPQVQLQVPAPQPTPAPQIPAPPQPTAAPPLPAAPAPQTPAPTTAPTAQPAVVHLAIPPPPKQAAAPPHRAGSVPVRRAVAPPPKPHVFAKAPQPVRRVVALPARRVAPFVPPAAPKPAAPWFGWGKL